ncbi:MAG: hypothetical protein A2096_06265 [Spirochaetes bacterium GWF1_41_5]|nr:MAG: hypothetical protein A2096_06265 [Spirochaetes bacterium GWF1_41_5]
MHPFADIYFFLCYTYTMLFYGFRERCLIMGFLPLIFFNCTGKVQLTQQEQPLKTRQTEQIKKTAVFIGEIINLSGKDRGDFLKNYMRDRLSGIIRSDENCLLIHRPGEAEFIIGGSYNISNQISAEIKLFRRGVNAAISLYNINDDNIDLLLYKIDGTGLGLLKDMTKNLHPGNSN